MKNKQTACNVTRREVLKTLVGGAVATIFSNQAASAAEAPGPSKAGKSAAEPYNILLILTDQERYFRPGELPKDFHLPAHERLVKKGIKFENHRINSPRVLDVLPGVKHGHTANPGEVRVVKH